MPSKQMTAERAMMLSFWHGKSIGDIPLVDIAGLTPKDCTCDSLPVFVLQIASDQVISLGRSCQYHALLRAEG